MIRMNLSNKPAFSIDFGVWIDPSMTKRLKRPASFHSPQSPATSGKITTGMIAFESANIL